MSDNKLLFVGRTGQLDAIRRAIHAKGRRILISIYGKGGMGKTYILREVERTFGSSPEIYCSSIIDFSQSKTRTRLWLMDKLSTCAESGFQNYLEAREKFGGTGTMEEEQVSDFIELEEAFLSDFRECEKTRRYLILLDTVELIQDTLLLDFVVKVARMAQNSIFILAGRNNHDLLPKFESELGAGGVIELQEIHGFNLESSLAYIKSREAGNKLSEDEQKTLHILADYGVPIKLALALDWLGRGLVMKTLVENSVDKLERLYNDDRDKFQKVIEEFERELVIQIGELGTNVDEVVYMMAHVHKRFNRGLLKKLMPDKYSEELLQKVQSLEFVKSIEPDYFVLHDEIQRMITFHVWDKTDPQRQVRQNINEKVIQYYDEEIANLEGADGKISSANEDDFQIFRIERLHYVLDLNLVDGYRQFMNIFEELRDQRQIEFASLALDTLVKDRPLPVRLRDFINTYYLGWILIRREELRKAREKIEEGLGKLSTGPTTDQVIKRREFLEQEVDQRIGNIYTQLGYCCRKLGDWSAAVQNYEDGRKLNESSLSDLLLKEQRDPEIVNRSLSSLAETLNDIANIQRLQGNLEVARYYCKTSYLIRRRLNKPDGMGHCHYVMGMIMWETGNTSEAMKFLQSARRHYQEAGLDALEHAWIDRYEGYIMFRTGNFEQAEELLMTALETTSGKQGWQDENAETLLFFSRISRDKEPGDYERSLKETDRALAAAKKTGNSYLATEAYLTLCLTILTMIRKGVRDQGHQEKLEEYFKLGKQIAEENRYRRLEALYAGIEADRAFDQKDFTLAFDQYTMECIKATEFKSAVYVRALSKLIDRLYSLAKENPYLVINLCDQIIEKWLRNGKRDHNFLELKSELAYIRNIARDLKKLEELKRDFENEFHRGSWQKASALIDEADRLPVHIHPDRAAIYKDFAEVYHGENNYSLARLFCERAIRISHDFPLAPDILGEIYLLLGRIYWKLGNTAEAAHSLETSERHFRKAASERGLGMVQLEKAFIYYRTHQFSKANEYIADAQSSFTKAKDDVNLARVFNLMSRMSRTDPRQSNESDLMYRQARDFGIRALDVLNNQDWYVAAEINLSLCILELSWGKWLESEHKLNEAQEHFTLAKQYISSGWSNMEEIESPMLYSVYRGMQGNLFVQEGNSEHAKIYFLDELVHATKTKQVRLIRALDLLENWLLTFSEKETEVYGNWFINQWNEKGLSEKFPQVVEALEWLIAHRRYIK